nr:uncharacterized protein LOC107261010 [Ipomoea trifida]
MQKMMETESLKDYTERLKKVVNKIRLLREELPDDRVVEKILTFFMHLKLKNNEGPTGMKVTLREHSKQMRLKVCRDVKFDETARWNWDKNEPENIKEESGEFLDDERIDDIPVRDENNINNDSAYGSRLHHVQHLIAPMRCGPTRYGFNVYTKTVRLDGTKPKRVCRKFNGDNKQIEALTRLLREHKQALMLDRGPTEQSRKNIEIVEELCGIVTQVDVCKKQGYWQKDKGQKGDNNKSENKASTSLPQM